MKAKIFTWALLSILRYASAPAAAALYKQIIKLRQRAKISKNPYDDIAVEILERLMAETAKQAALKG